MHIFDYSEKMFSPADEPDYKDLEEAYKIISAKITVSKDIHICDRYQKALCGFNDTTIIDAEHIDFLKHRMERVTCTECILLYFELEATYEYSRNNRTSR